MGRRGRPPTLKDRKTTSVSLESWQDEFIKTKGIDLSKFVRDNIDALMQSDESPIEQLEREIIEIRQQIQELDTIARQKEIKRDELKDLMAKEEEEGKFQNEFEDKRRSYIRDCKKMMQAQQTCNRFWMEHLTENWKFSTFDEAKDYVRNVWLDDGVPDKRIKTFLRLN